jgi:hypothetical protein
MNQSQSNPLGPEATAVRRLLLLVGAPAPAEARASDYDAVVGLCGVSPSQGRLRYRFQLGPNPAELRKLGALCVLFFPNAVRFDVCGRTPAAAVLYSELRGLAEFDGGFEARLLGSATGGAAARETEPGPSSPSVTV